MHILELGKSRSADSRARIEEALQDSSEDVSLLAEKILELWNDSDDTFYFHSPRVLKVPSIPEDRVRSLLPDQSEAFVVIVKVRVDKRGCPEAFEMSAGAQVEVALLKQLESKVIHSVVNDALYLPAKVGDEYVEGTAMLTLHLDVH